LSIDQHATHRQQRKHVWVAPPPGQGRAQVCDHCGERNTPNNQGLPCGGDQRFITGLTGADRNMTYDPYA